MNKNYCGTVVRVAKLVPLTNCDNVQGAMIFGQHVIVGKDVQVGDLGVFFPVEVALSKEFLRANNLYRKPELNLDTNKKGYFEEHGRVRAMKFRGHQSAGFFVPLEYFSFVSPERYKEKLVEGFDFDELMGVPICRKYTPAVNPPSKFYKEGRRSQLHSVQSRIVYGQFKYHEDTANLRRNMDSLWPHQVIWVSYKYHGTSAIIGHLLTDKPLPLWKRLFNVVFPVFEQGQEYSLVWASRRVIKGVEAPKKDANHFYGEDIWGVVAKEVEPFIPEGITVYGEIVGFTPNGTPIQKGYDYHCQPKEHRFLVYRITYTSPRGQVIEFSYPQIKRFCNKQLLEHVGARYYGEASGLVPHGVNEPITEWRERFLEYLNSEVNGKLCFSSKGTVPMEGLVLKVEEDELTDGQLFFKIKNFDFFVWETNQLDKGEVDIETQESQ